MFLFVRDTNSSPVALESSTHEYLSIRGTSSNAFLTGTNIVKHKPSNSPFGVLVFNSTLRTPWGLCGGKSEPNISYNKNKFTMRNTNYSIVIFL